MLHVAWMVSAELNILYKIILCIFFILMKNKFGKKKPYTLNGWFKSVIAFFRLTTERYFFLTYCQMYYLWYANKKIWFYAKILMCFMLFKLHVRKKNYLSFPLKVTVLIKLKSKWYRVLTTLLISYAISPGNFYPLSSIC